VCDRADNDCDGAIDEGATDADTWYADGDGDGFGDPEQATFACAPPAGAVSDNTDCDDGDPALYPGNGGLNQFCEDRGVNPNAASCATSPSGSWWVVALAAVGLRRRSRARPT
jgi:MYXO-CTERM domain-containing protein